MQKTDCTQNENVYWLRWSKGRMNGITLLNSSHVNEFYNDYDKMYKYVCVDA